MSPHAEALLKALNRGIRQLRQSGELRAILEDAGFYPKRTRGWQVVNNPKRPLLKPSLYNCKLTAQH
ncbi:hypothetical protein [Agaribacterium haliotis]|uniref:hypothetical protein n=1 Tax=Agaribacterium haliotis TaxID=2013869 RepID=UPI000BB5622F|nr:hypothetical protein [Agaribacterium haliotis]